ncbi:histidinol-phosphate transaminase [Bifidobacterium sp.]|jgi:histidinol-phosphate aminotransferase|uniref:histidinol-phosphate transaminase n=1 Tax=Bifidobacterium sp. TaxID=41200 RepID=UPI0025C073CC|nr:histidinol-phosphate transaminase [Bifidobacterium sp.]MCH4209031.1 histidinol-phosphate transaminase [Bifidobacterium sp.]MCI1225038.1 histidinol-phosphate transaminase [Bifidobacterium sp.]
MTYRHRAIIDGIPAYRQGKSAPRTQGRRSFKISSNENPFMPLPGVVEEIRQRSLGRINRYPDMRGWELVERLAALDGVEPENVVLGCGSSEVITQLVSLVAGPGDEIVYPWRSFEAYPIIVAGAGATSVQVPNRPDGSHDIDGIIGALNEHTRLVILNNPNNPTATSLSDADARRVMEAVPSDVLVLFDEAYFQFNTDPDASVALDLFREYPNIVVAHTFSKAYGLAGLRVGYAVAPADVIEGMRKVSLPFAVSDVAQRAALASLDVSQELEGRVKLIIGERDRVVAALRSQGWQFAEPYANFFWLPLGESTDAAAAAFVEAGLSVRVFGGEGIRITIGEPEANDMVIEVCRQLKERGL